MTVTNSTTECQNWHVDMNHLDYDDGSEDDY